MYTRCRVSICAATGTTLASRLLFLKTDWQFTAPSYLPPPPLFPNMIFPTSRLYFIRPESSERRDAAAASHVLFRTLHEQRSGEPCSLGEYFSEYLLSAPLQPYVSAFALINHTRPQLCTAALHSRREEGKKKKKARGQGRWWESKLRFFSLCTNFITYASRRHNGSDSVLKLSIPHY